MCALRCGWSVRLEKTFDKSAYLRTSVMAAGDSVRFPPVTFDDDVPKPGFARIILTVHEMEVVKPALRKSKVKNAEIHCSFANSVLLARVTVAGESAPIVYEYKKNLPYDIREKDCKWEVRGSTIVVTLAKAKNESWVSQHRYFLQPPTAPDC